jgi:N-acetylglutamate synthase-like GNAT family acetyltransferase
MARATMAAMPAVAPQTAWEARRGAYTVTTDPARLDLDVIHGYLFRAYWSAGIPRATLERAVRHSLCFTLLEEERPIGLVRVITDYTTFAYVCDVFVLESHQGKGLGKWMMQCVRQHPELQGLRRWHLVTRDAHPLYRGVGFTALQQPERHMELYTADIHKLRNFSEGTES